MNESSNPDYPQMFRKLALRHLPHHGLLSLAVKYGNEQLTNRLDQSTRKRYLGNLTLKAYPQEQLDEYRMVADRSAIWHGTGRYQYSGGKIVDTFRNILSHGSLNPTDDVYLMALNGQEIQSISATRSRIIARCYADTHGLGAREQNRYGSSLWWVSYYYGLFYLEVTAKHGFAMIRHRRAFDKASTDANGERTWGKKVHTQAKSVWDTFGLGSDIPGNYPILIAIREENVRTAALFESMQKWEVRLTDKVDLSAIGHIEVPEQHMNETAELLSAYGYSIPIFPLELGEFAASKDKLADLLYKK